MTSSETKPSDLSITVEFSGGAELLFDNKKKYDLKLPAEQEWTLKKLLFWIKDNLLRDRPELFMVRDSVRPGILVLVNDADWELLPMIVPMYHFFPILPFVNLINFSLMQYGQGEYKLQPKDTVHFISTLHGG